MIRFEPVTVKAQGCRELSSHTANARATGLGRAEVGGGWLCGHWTSGMDPFPSPPSTEVQYSSRELELAQATATATSTSCACTTGIVG